MKKLLLILLLASPVFAGKANSFKDPVLNDEFDNNYFEHKFPNWVIAKGSTATITYVQISTIAAKSGTYVALTATTLTASTGTINSFMVVGTATNDNAPNGRLGEIVSNTATVTAVTAGYTTIASIPLTTGDWDVSLVMFSRANTSLVEVLCGLSATNNGDPSAGLGDYAVGYPASATFDGAGAIASNRNAISGSVTYYLTCKSFGASSSTTGRISARRAR